MGSEMCIRDSIIFTLFSLITSPVVVDAESLASPQFETRTQNFDPYDQRDSSTTAINSDVDAEIESDSVVFNLWSSITEVIKVIFQKNL